MRVEFEPAFFRKTLLSAGLDETQVREISTEFSKNDLSLEDERLVDMLMHFGMDMFSIISVFGKLGIGEETVIRIIEKQERSKLGASADIYTLEVEPEAQLKEGNGKRAQKKRQKKARGGGKK